jgi:hypothetical protein
MRLLAAMLTSLALVPFAQEVKKTTASDEQYVAPAVR